MVYLKPSIVKQCTGYRHFIKPKPLPNMAISKHPWTVLMRVETSIKAEGTWWRGNIHLQFFPHDSFHWTIWFPEWVSACLAFPVGLAKKIGWFTSIRCDSVTSKPRFLPREGLGGCVGGGGTITEEFWWIRVFILQSTIDSTEISFSRFICKSHGLINCPYQCPLHVENNVKTMQLMTHTHTHAHTPAQPWREAKEKKKNPRRKTNTADYYAYPFYTWHIK